MVNLLKRWAKNTDGAVKFCVSSREYNVFQNALSADQRFRLQDLTRYDIKRYVQAQLDHMDDKFVKSSLVSDIVARSSGIFLWVALVVKALRQCIEDGSDIARFRAELRHIPDELEGLFTYLLEPTLKSTRGWTYQIYSLMLSIPHDHHIDTFTLLDISFLDDYVRDTDFATKSDFLFKKGMDEATQIERQNTTWKRVNGSCRGLVEKKTTIHGQSLIFAHRSVSDFVQKQSTRNRMVEYIEGFQPEMCLSQLFTATIRSLSEQHYIPATAHKFKALLNARHKLLLDHEPYEFLEFLESIIDRQEEMDNFRHYYEILALWPKKIKKDNLWNIDLGPFATGRRIISPVYHSVGQFLWKHPHYRYVEWKLLQDDKITKSIYSVLFFLASLFRGPLEEVATQIRLSKLVIEKTLLTNSLESFVSYSIKASGVDATWVRFLRQALRHFARSSLESSDYEHGLWAEIMIYFLRFGADPRFQSHRRGHSTIYFVSFESPRSVSDVSAFSDDITRFFKERLDDGQEFFTLRRLIEIWNLPRKEEIFDLISESEKRFVDLKKN